jgi:hypothetical protein
MQGTTNIDGAAAVDRITGYAVGLRILTDRGLLRQIRDELKRRAMSLAAIAQLENVSPTVLLQVVEAGLDPSEDPSWSLRQFARDNAAYTTAAWITSRGKLSRRHIVNPAGEALCGIPLGAERELLDVGPCRTCAERAGVASPPSIVGARQRPNHRLEAVDAADVHSVVDHRLARGDRDENGGAWASAGEHPGAAQRAA